MNTATKIRMAVDMGLLVLLPVLMAELLTGQEFHEWMGVLMGALLLLHLRLNRNWLKNLGRGNYTSLRSFSTMLNLLLFTDMAALLVSGIMMSGFVFQWLPISGGMVLSRRIHLFASHWGFILMALHMGMHWNMVVQLGGKLRKSTESEDWRTWLARGLAAATCLFGVYAFLRQNMVDYLFLRTAFVFWDETKSAALFLAETLAMMGLFIAISYYGQKRMKGAKTER